MTDACQVRKRGFPPPGDSEAELITTAEFNTRYQIHGELGKGTFGKVLKGIDVTSGRCVAIKYINADRFGHDNTIERMLEGWQIMQHVSHPNIVQIYALLYNAESKLYYLIMEFIAGNDAYDAVRVAKDLRAAVMAVGKGVLTALEYLHASGLAHNDVKSQNVIVGSDGSVKLADLDFICRLQECASRRVIGTHLSPDLLLIHDQYEIADLETRQASDVWSVGLMMAHLYLGKYPFPFPERDSHIAWYNAIVNSQPILPPGEIGFICEKALQKDPKQRPTASELRSDVCGAQYSHAERRLRNQLFEVQESDQVAFFFAKYPPETQNIIPILKDTFHLMMAVTQVRNDAAGPTMFIGMHPSGYPGGFVPGGTARLWAPDPLSANSPTPINYFNTQNPIVYILSAAGAKQINEALAECQFVDGALECEVNNGGVCETPFGAGKIYNCDNWIHRLFPALKSDARGA